MYIKSAKGDIVPVKSGGVMDNPRVALFRSFLVHLNRIAACAVWSLQKVDFLSFKSLCGRFSECMLM